MSRKITVLAAEPDFIARRGVESLVNEQLDFELIPSVRTSVDLMKTLKSLHPDVVIIDYNHFPQGTELLKQIRKTAPMTGILVITDPRNNTEINRALESGATGFLLKECEQEEIIEAICKTSESERMLCGKILGRLTASQTEEQSVMEVSCAGLNVSDREIEIIRHVAEGLSNKEIAEKLFLSTHTVNTHRKNIMNKLQVNNTAGLVLFAVRNDLLGPNKFLFS
jgi:DNA-binding NarL/FixJ family response regulator